MIGAMILIFGVMLPGVVFKNFIIFSHVWENVFDLWIMRNTIKS